MYVKGRKWQRLLGHEREQRLRLEEMVEQLARQHSQVQLKEEQRLRLEEMVEQLVRQHCQLHREGGGVEEDGVQYMVEQQARQNSQVHKISKLG
jgi:predicted phage gp36 major capsid-like protein